MAAAMAAIAIGQRASTEPEPGPVVAPPAPSIDEVIAAEVARQVKAALKGVKVTISKLKAKGNASDSEDEDDLEWCCGAGVPEDEWPPDDVIKSYFRKELPEREDLDGKRFGGKGCRVSLRACTTHTPALS